MKFWFIGLTTGLLFKLSAPAQVLGRGYDSKTNQFKEVCVIGETHYLGTHKSELNYNLNITRSTNQLEILGRMEAGVDIFIASGKAKVTFKSETQSKNHVYFVSTRIQYQPKTRQLVNQRLSALGLEAQKFGDGLSFHKLCGDQYVVSWSPDVSLWLVSRYEFENVKTELEVTMKFKIEVLGQKVTKTERERFSAYNHAVDASHVVAAEGIIPSQLQAMLEPSATHCQKGQIEQCSKMTELINNYFTSSEFEFDLLQSHLLQNKQRLTNYPERWIQ